MSYDNFKMSYKSALMVDMLILKFTYSLVKWIYNSSIAHLEVVQPSNHLPPPDIYKLYISYEMK